MAKNPDFDNLYYQFCAAESQKANWYAYFSEIYRYVLPNRTAFNVAYDYDNAARYENLQIYDFTPVYAAYARANELHGLLMPKDRRWASFKVNEQKIKQPLPWEILTYIDNSNAFVFSEIERSNLAVEAANVLIDLVGGMGCLKIESIDDNTPFKFTCIPAYLVYVGTNQSDCIERVWVKDQFTRWQLLEAFPETIKLPNVAQAEDLDLLNIYTGQIKLPNGNYFVYMFCKEYPNQPFYKKELYYKPLVVVRDRVHPGESEGRGIAMDIIWQIRDLNTVCKQHLRSIAVKADPPIFFDSTLPVNPFSLRNGLSGAMLPQRPGQPVPFRAMDMPQSPDVAVTVQDLRDQIKTAFQVEPLGTIDQPVHSATEIAIRENRAQRTLSTDMSRLINDLPKAVFETCVKIMVHRGLIHFSMNELNKQGKLLFDFASPLQDIQSAQDLQNLAQSFQLIQQFYGEGALLTATDVEQVREFLINSLRLPHNLFNSPDKIRAQLALMAKSQADQAAPPVPTTSAQNQPDFQPQPVGTAA